MLTSEDLRLFLAIIREGSMYAAGRRLEVDHSTIVRRLSVLEARLDTRLFDRSTRGVTPTQAAYSLVDHAERVESELLEAMSSLAGQDRKIEGSVRLTTPEALGSLLIAPNIPRLQQRHPNLHIELVTDSRSSSLSKREADVAIMLNPPPRGRLVTRRLADYRIGLYGSVQYLTQYGYPQKISDLNDHLFVSYIEELVGFPEMIALHQVLPDARIGFRSSSSAAQQAAVAASAGLGMLHHFAAQGDPRLIRLFPQEVEVKRSYWLVLHRDLQKLPRVRAVIDFLDEIMSSLAPTL